MLFELSYTPVSFQGYISKILAKKLNVFVIFYLDNILIYTKNTGQAHVNTIYWMLNKLMKHNLFTNLKKCCFHKNKV